MIKETFIQSNGMPRTKGIRNPNVVAAQGRRGGKMRDRRDRRPNDARRNREWEA